MSDYCSICGDSSNLTIVGIESKLIQYRGKTVCGHCRFDISSDNVCGCGSYNFQNSNGFKVCVNCGLTSGKEYDTYLEMSERQFHIPNVLFGTSIGKFTERINTKYHRLSRIGNNNTTDHKMRVRRDMNTEIKRMLSLMHFPETYYFNAEKIAYKIRELGTKIVYKNKTLVSALAIYTLCKERKIYRPIEEFVMTLDLNKKLFTKAIIRSPIKAPNSSRLELVLDAINSKGFGNDIKSTARWFVKQFPNYFEHVKIGIAAGAALHISDLIHGKTIPLRELTRTFLVTEVSIRCLKNKVMAIYQKKKEKKAHPHALSSERILQHSTILVQNSNK